MPLEIIREDITRMAVDAIVNPSNSLLRMGSFDSVSGQIFYNAGLDELTDTCKKIGKCELGQAIITPGFKLPSKYIIHVAGPVWDGGKNHEEEYLADCYRNALNLALEYGLTSIAFPLLSSGSYGYPKDKALHTALSTIQEFLLENDMLVYLVVFDKKAFGLSQKLTSSIKKYIDDHYVEDYESDEILLNTPENRIKLERFQERERSLPKGTTIGHYEAPSLSKSDLEDILDDKDVSFRQGLFDIIDRKGLTDVQVYKKANISKAVFSNLKSSDNYQPSKTTALAFCIALELNMKEAQELLSKAGYSLSRSSILDLIVSYFIQHKIYNILELNAVLYDNDQALLGSIPKE